MAFEAWRYEPLDPARFPVGQGPFRIRGQAFLTALSYVDRRLPGGRKAFLKALGKGDPYASFYTGPFVTERDYDVSPLLRLLSVAAGLAHVPVGKFIQARSRWSARTDGRATWTPTSTKELAPEVVAERLHLSFNHYNQPTQSRPLEIGPGRFVGELFKVPAPMNGFYACATIGFVSSALEVGGAKEPRFDWQQPTLEGEHAGVPLQRVRFIATWR